MKSLKHRSVWTVNIHWRTGTVPVLLFVLLFAMTVMAGRPAVAQTFTVLHQFTGGADGKDPAAGLTEDAGGNLYGTAQRGGNQNCFGSCGTVYKSQRHGSNWVTTPIYKFTGGADGALPYGRVIFGPDGALYGTTFAGGTNSCLNPAYSGCGTVFKLQPKPTNCVAFPCTWDETILYSFASQSDGEFPQAEVAFDQAGNMYGTTQFGGAGPCHDGFFTGCGTVFKLTHNPNGSWTKTTVYSFQNGPNDGGFPVAGVVLDQAGNIYGSTAGGGLQCFNQACGVVFELTPSGSGWTESILHFFTGGADGEDPGSGVIFDSAGNLFGAAESGGTGQGTIYELSPGQNGWDFTVQYTFSLGEANAPGPLTMGSVGNIYGSSDGGGTYSVGTVYKLTAENGTWSYTTLNSFNFQGDSGFFPEGKVVLDTQGSVYGTASQGPYPQPDAGTLFEVTP